LYCTSSSNQELLISPNYIDTSISRLDAQITALLDIVDYTILKKNSLIFKVKHTLTISFYFNHIKCNGGNSVFLQYSKKEIFVFRKYLIS